MTTVNYSIDNIRNNLSTIFAKSSKTFDDIAVELQVDTRSLYYWISGEKKPSLTTLMRISELFKVTIDYILSKH